MIELFVRSLIEVGCGLLSIGGGILRFLWFILLPSQMPALTLWLLLFLSEGTLPNKTLRQERIIKLIIVLVIIVSLLVYLAAFHAARIYFEYDPLGIVTAANNPTGLGTTMGILVVIGAIGAFVDAYFASYVLSVGRGY
jgi:hypothetical protein